MPKFHYLPVVNPEYYQRGLGLNRLNPSAIAFIEDILKKPYLTCIRHELDDRIKDESDWWGIDLGILKFQQSDYYAEMRTLEDSLPAVVKAAMFEDTPPLTDVDCERPNHGIAHTLRVTYYVKMLIKFFLNNANDQNKFHAINNRKSIQQIQHMALFLVVGRLNEQGWPGSKLTSWYFRWRDAELFNHYMLRPDVNGEPNYLACGFEDKDDVRRAYNCIVKLGTHDIQDAEYIIIEAAHRLDLMRCSNDEEHYNSRFDDYMYLHADSDSDLSSLKDTAYKLLTATGDYSLTYGAEQCIYDGYRHPLLEAANSSAARCFEIMWHAKPDQATAYQQIAPANYYYAIRVAAPVKNADIIIHYLNPYDQIISDTEKMITVSNEPINNHPRRHSSKRTYTIALDNDSENYQIMERHKKNLSANHSQKSGFSSLMAVSLRHPRSMQPVYTSFHVLTAWHYATGLRIKAAFTKSDSISYSRIFMSDSYTSNRSCYDYNNISKAMQQLDSTNLISMDENRQGMITPKYLPRLLSDPEQQGNYNEALARIKCDYRNPMIDVEIHSPTLEACILAQARAKHVRQRLEQRAKVDGGKLPKNYEVKIYFNLPYFALHGQEYSRRLQQEHREEARKCLKQMESDDNFIPLLAIDHFAELHTHFKKIFPYIINHAKHQIYILELILLGLKFDNFYLSILKEDVCSTLKSVPNDSLRVAYIHAGEHGYINLLQFMGPPNLYGVESQNAIFCAAAQRGQYFVMEWLLNAPKGLTSSSDDLNVLETAAQYGQTELCQLWLKHHPDSFFYGNCPVALYAAASAGQIKTFRFLLSYYEGTSDSDRIKAIPIKRIRTHAFRMACIGGHITIINELIEKYPSLLSEIKDDVGGIHCYYYHAILRGHWHICQYFKNMNLVDEDINSKHALYSLFERPNFVELSRFLAGLKKFHLLQELSGNFICADYNLLDKIISHFIDHPHPSAANNIFNLVTYLFVENNVYELDGIDASGNTLLHQLLFLMKVHAERFGIIKSRAGSHSSFFRAGRQCELDMLANLYNKFCEEEADVDRLNNDYLSPRELFESICKEYDYHVIKTDSSLDNAMSALRCRLTH